MSIITDLVGNAVSVAFSEFTVLFKDQRERQKRQDQIMNSLCRILTNEQDNIYFNELFRFLDQSRLKLLLMRSFHTVTIINSYET